MMNFGFDFNKYNSAYDPFADFTMGMKPKRRDNPMIPDDMFDLDRKQAVMGAEPSNKFVNPEGDPKGRAKKDAMLNIGLALLQNAFEPGSNIGEGIGEAIGAGASTYRDSRNRYVAEDRDLEDRELRLKMENARLLRENESHDWGREDQEEQRAQRGRDAAFRSSVGDLRGQVPEERQGMFDVLAPYDPSGALGVLGGQLNRGDELMDSRKRGELGNELSLNLADSMVEKGHNVKDIDRFRKSNSQFEQSMKMREKENAAQDQWRVLSMVAGDMTAQDSKDQAVARQMTIARLNAQNKTDAFSVMTDKEADETSGGKFSEMYKNTLEEVQGLSRKTMGQTYGRLGRLAPDTGMAELTPDFFDMSSQGEYRLDLGDTIRGMKPGDVYNNPNPLGAMSANPNAEPDRSGIVFPRALGRNAPPMPGTAAPGPAEEAIVSRYRDVGATMSDFMRLRSQGLSDTQIMRFYGEQTRNMQKGGFNLNLSGLGGITSSEEYGGSR